MENSILNSIKQLLGISADETVFDTDIIIHINSVIASLTQMGIGPSNGFEIVDNSATWTDFLEDDKRLNSVRSYIYMKVRLIFDPPTSSAVIEAYKQQIAEFEWRNYIVKDIDRIEENPEDKFKPVKVSDLLYTLSYDSLDYKFGKEYIEKHYRLPELFGCTSVRAGNFIGKNYDWYYNWETDFVVKTKRTKEHFASLGVASSIHGLTKQYMERHNDPSLFAHVPFLIVDGINEHGVYVGVNIVPAQKGFTTGTTPVIHQRERVCTVMLSRYILDHYSSAQQAVEDIDNYISIYNSTLLMNLGMEAHFMIADSTKTYILEFINNELCAMEFVDINTAMTNFYIYGVEFNNDGTVYTPETQDSTHNAIITNHIQSHGQGLERWNIAINNLGNSMTKDGMIDLMRNKLNYNLSYTLEENIWYTEFAGFYSNVELTVISDVSEYALIISKAKEAYTHRNRDLDRNGIWHTTHTSVYDLSNKCLYLYDSTEDGKEHVFFIED